MMPLRDLLRGLDARGPGAAADVPVTGVTTDSRRVRPGDLFVALGGLHHDGHDHAADAARAGAAALLVQRPVPAPVPVAVVPSTLTALSPVAARFYGHPSRDLRVMGVTGTNGKTTITYVVEHLLRGAGRRAGVMGTIDYRWPGRVEKAANTTPFASDVQRLLAAMRADGVTDVAMEVSSHALAQHRVEDVVFRVGVFTNLTQDHLDFHKNMDDYFAAKARLFELLARAGGAAPAARRAVINADDPHGPRLLAGLRVPAWTYAVDAPADLRAEDLSLSAAGCRFRLVSPAGARAVRFPLVGRHNVYNALAAAGAALALDVDFSAVVAGLESMTGVPGRLEPVTEEDGLPSRAPFSVFVDYAHTDDALRNVLETLRPLTRGRLIVLFGCGGDRDKTKRPRMGEVAARLADHVIVTSDNPRSEDPDRIAQEVVAGVRRVPGRSHEVWVDRAQAVARAIGMGRAGDVILLAGKGHETSQIFKDHTADFDDRVEARRALRARG